MAQFLNIDGEAVQSHIREGGPVAELLNDVAKGVQLYSVDYISDGHVRSGRLLRGLWWNRSKLEGPLQGVARAGSSARHTVYFHDGTAGNGAGYIVSPNMIVPKRRTPHTNPAFKGAGSQLLAQNAALKGGKGVKRMSKVRGQRAKPFLEKGLAASLKSQRL